MKSSQGIRKDWVQIEINKIKAQIYTHARTYSAHSIETTIFDVGWFKESRIQNGMSISSQLNSISFLIIQKTKNKNSLSKWANESKLRFNHLIPIINQFWCLNCILGRSEQKPTKNLFDLPNRICNLNREHTVCILAQ